MTASIRFKRWHIRRLTECSFHRRILPPQDVESALVAFGFPREIALEAALSSEPFTRTVDGHEYRLVW